MAIEDSTSYELTGAQVKDLANKIKGKAADNTFVGATSAAPGSRGLVPEPQAGDDTKFLSGDGTWQDVPAVNNGALTIQQNGTILDTFTANSSDDKTVDIQTITAEIAAPAEEVGAITASMIADGAVTNTKIDFSTFIKTGTVQVEYQANGTGGGFVNVTFDTPFTHAPVVFAQDLLSNGQVSSLTVSNVTATGFRVLARSTFNQSSGIGTVNWLAFSQQG